MAVHIYTDMDRKSPTYSLRPTKFTVHHKDALLWPAASVVHPYFTLHLRSASVFALHCKFSVVPNSQSTLPLPHFLLILLLNRGCVGLASTWWVSLKLFFLEFPVFISLVHRNSFHCSRPAVVSALHLCSGEESKSLSSKTEHGIVTTPLMSSPSKVTDHGQNAIASNPWENPQGHPKSNRIHHPKWPGIHMDWGEKPLVRIYGEIHAVIIGNTIVFLHK